ncbi:MAG: zinc ribbon domain-containing protein, partial [Oscillospiraceae bacterium]
MTCPNCDSHVAEGVQFCPNCGANVFLDAASVSEQKPPKKAKRKLNLKAILLVAAVIFVVILVFVFVRIFSGNKGEKIANSLSEKLGRSVTIAEKYAGVTLSETSEFSVLKEIVKYDYIIESEKIVKVCGIRM